MSFDNRNREVPLIEVEGLGKAFGAVQVLNEVGFTVRPGEVHVLAGENGAGKSTLLRILNGAYDDFTGSYRFKGKPVHFRSPASASEAGIAMIHQELSLVPDMSVLDNIFLGRESVSGPFAWLRRDRQVEKARESLSRLGLDLDPHTRVGELPISKQQMVEVAKALAFEAEVIIFDEPTSALNQPEAERLIEQVKLLRAEGKGIVYTSHKMDEIYQIADRITILRDGCHVLTETALELSREALVQALVGRRVVEQYPTRRDKEVGEALLEVRNLSVPDPFGRAVNCVDDVSFSVGRGEILGIAGLEGSGNHELLLGLFGSYGLLGGEVRIEGTSCPIASPAAAIESGLALVTNDRKGNGLVLDMGIVRNVTLAALPQFSPGTWLQPSRELAAAERCVERLNIVCSSLGQSVRSLSGGNQQKVLLGKWLETSPKVLLLDDPTRGVDVGAKREIYKSMREWARAGMAIVLLSSELPELLALSDRVIVMHRGGVTGEFTREQLNQDDVMCCALGGSSFQQNARARKDR